MSDVESYAASLLEESLGLVQGSAAGWVTDELASALTEAMAGSEACASPEPKLDELILSIGERIAARHLAEEGFFVRKARWPNAAWYAACLTHDVDNVSWPRNHIRERRSRFSTFDYALAMLGLRSVYDNTPYAANLEERRGLRSSFYFLTKNYDLRRLSPRLASLEKRGWEVGLHGDFGTHDSAERMAEAVASFERATGIRPRGLREHFLQFDYAKTWRIMEDAGFVYDATVGNRDALGFRLGTCTPFHPPDQAWTPMRLLELPLVLMDTTLWGYLKRTEEEGSRDFTAMKERVRRVGGLFTVLWHPESMRMRGGRIYPSLLDELKKEGCFIGCGEAIADWWNARSRPLRLEEGRLAMEDAPPGLCLEFKAKEEMRLSVEGGSLETRVEGLVVKAKGGRLAVSVG